MDAYEIPGGEERYKHGVCYYLRVETVLDTIEDASAARLTVYCRFLAFLSKDLAMRFVFADTNAGLQRYTILGTLDLMSR